MATLVLLFVILPLTTTVRDLNRSAAIPSPRRHRHQIITSRSSRPRGRGELGPDQRRATPANAYASGRRRGRRSLEALLEVETGLRARGYSYVVGSDDTGGAGCIAGPVVVASCCLLRPFSTFLPTTTSTFPSSGCPMSESAMRALADVDDCKALTPGRRREIYDVVRSHPNVFAVSIARRSPREIDEGNLARVTMHAFAESIEALVDGYELPFDETYAIVDGRESPKLYSSERAHGGSESAPKIFSVRPYVDGDARVYTVALASILARVERDEMMEDLHREHPLYGFDRHFGFGTRDHVEAIHRLGAIEGVHRMSFKQVKGR